MEGNIPSAVLQKYSIMSKKGEGTFAEVVKIQSLQNGDLFALKKMKTSFETIDQVNNLREIQALRRLSPHPNIIKLSEIIFEKSSGRLCLVFELMDMNLYELIKGRKQYLPEKKVVHIMYQVMKGLDHMHRNGVFHRDIKPENILIREDKVKIADFGSCRGIYSKQPYTEYISTRWYRPPECLLTDGYYTYKMDIWGAGCVLYEIATLRPLFPGTNELSQIQLIHDVLGSPSAAVISKIRRNTTSMSFNFVEKEGSGLLKVFPNSTPDSYDLLARMLLYDPDDRITARHALRHLYFKDLRDHDTQKPQSKGAPATVSADGDQRNAMSLTKSGKGASKGHSDQQKPFPSISSYRYEDITQMASKHANNETAPEVHEQPRLLPHIRKSKGDLVSGHTGDISSVNESGVHKHPRIDVFKILFPVSCFFSCR
eukprot:TRINITY_DN2565_c0_g1_i5.p1 TRINITY_DN2565_c0_g1~~TRINITY_DN2565_c0_g1_i5.p1  ORF type:complete len:428 (-),score=79.78 TRINITY_DN2565_c0_g1_i5:735-2018(-)